MSEPLVHILVINWNGIEHLEACYRSLCASPYERVQFVLVDNHSDDGSVAYVRDTFGSDPRVAILELPANLGWSGGNNAGIQRALDLDADYVMLLNNDTATDPGAIQAMTDMMEADPELGALAPKMLMFDTPDIINSTGLMCSVVGACWDRGLGRLDQPKWNTPEPVIGACGGAAFFRASVLRKIGFLPEDFGIYLDDLDLCLRVWDAGYAIASCPAASVRHKFSATMGTGARLRHKYFLNTRNRGRLMLRNFPAAQLIRYAPAYFLGEGRAVGRAVLDGEIWKTAVHARAWWDNVLQARRGRAAYRRFHTEHGARCRFWPLIVQSPLFFPGAEFPEDGWYAARDVGGNLLKPMSRNARMMVTGGKLRLIHANCYPALGATDVVVSQGSRELLQLSTFENSEACLDVESGPLEFTARHIFDADNTGERFDIGGWIGVSDTAA